MACQQINKQTLLDQLTTFKNEENVKFWILDRDDNQFKIVEGNKEDANNECLIYNEDNFEGNYRIYSGPFETKQEAKETINIVKYIRGDKSISAHWILKFNNDFEIFYGNYHHVCIRMNHSNLDRVLGPSTRVQAQKFLGSINPLYKKSQNNGIQWILENIHVYTSSLGEERVKEYCKKISSSRSTYRVLAGPLTNEQAEKIIKKERINALNE